MCGVENQVALRVRNFVRKLNARSIPGRARR